MGTSYHKAIIFHVLIGLVEDMTNIDFGLTRLTVKVTRVTCKNINMVSTYYLKNNVFQSF